MNSFYYLEDYFTKTKKSKEDILSELEWMKEFYGLIYIITNSAQPKEYKGYILTCFNKPIDKLIFDVDNYISELSKEQDYESKPYQYLYDCGGVMKVIAKKNPPCAHNGVKRKTEDFKSYDWKLYNSISRAGQTLYDLVVCNDWDFFVTFTINKERYDRFNLKAYMSAFTKWLHNYSARKTGGAKIRYVLIAELGKSGAWHLHGVISGIPLTHLSPFNPKEHPHLAKKKYLNWAAYQKKFGYCAFGKIESKERIAGYITKSFRTPWIMQARELHSKLYINSQGLRRPIEIDRGYGIVDIDTYDFENEYVGVKKFHDKRAVTWKAS